MVGHSLSSQRSNPRSALTLIDMVVTVLLTGILAATAVPRFAAALQRQRVSSAAQRICADIRWLRNTAIASSTSKRIDITIAQSSYTLIGVASPDKAGADYSLQLADGTYATTVVSANLGGDATLTFDLHGQPDSGGTIVIRCGGALSIITVNASTGEATAS
jgi:Tfp pilus assembly protein FimT